MAAASLGAEVRFAGKIGDDSLGCQLEQALLREGVKPFLRRDGQVRTGSSLVLSFTTGCRHFISCQPNNDTLAFSDLDLSMLAGADHLLRADVWFSKPMLAEGNAELLRAARQRGLATSLDLNWDPLWSVAEQERIAARKEAVRRILPLVDLVHGNIRELGLFADSPDLEETLKRLAAWGAGATVIHMGSQGAGYYYRGRLTVEPCAPVRRRLNTAGTGDLLSTCLILLHRHEEMPVTEKLRLANRVVADYMEGTRNFLRPLSAT